MGLAGHLQSNWPVELDQAIGQSNWPVELDLVVISSRTGQSNLKVSIAIGQSNWPVELDLEELFFHLRAQGNEIQSDHRSW